MSSKRTKKTLFYFVRESAKLACKHPRSLYEYKK